MYDEADVDGVSRKSFPTGKQEAFVMKPNYH